MSEGRKPTLFEALATLLVVAAILVVGIRLQLGIVAVFVPLTLGIGVVGCLSP